MKESKALIKKLAKNGISIPPSHAIVGTMGDTVVVKRPDGLKVFLSPKDSNLINYIRIYESKAEKVMLAVGIYRGLQIADNYNRQYGKKKITFLNMLNENVVGDVGLPRLETAP